MDISNKTLAILLVGSLIMSGLGTILSLQKIDNEILLFKGSGTPTGMAGTQIGNVSLTVGSALSITTADSPTLAFGTCTLTGGDAYLTSENANTICPDLPRNITVRNDGNVPANVTFTVNDTGEAHGGVFIPSPSASTSYIAYKLQPGGYGTNKGGCWNNSKIDTQTWGSNGSTIDNNYINLTGITVKYLGCTNLSSGSTNNSFLLYTHIYVPASTSAGVTAMTFTFTGSNV